MFFPSYSFNIYSIFLHRVAKIVFHAFVKSFFFLNHDHYFGILQVIKIEVYKCKLSEVACLAQQSARVPAVRSNLLPRRLRQRSRLIDKQTRQPNNH